MLGDVIKKGRNLESRKVQMKMAESRIIVKHIGKGSPSPGEPRFPSAMLGCTTGCRFVKYDLGWKCPDSEHSCDRYVEGTGCTRYIRSGDLGYDELSRYYVYHNPKNENEPMDLKRIRSYQTRGLTEMSDAVEKFRIGEVVDTKRHNPPCYEWVIVGIYKDHYWLAKDGELCTLTDHKMIKRDQKMKTEQTEDGKFVGSIKSTSLDVRKSLERGLDQGMSRATTDIVFEQFKKMAGNSWPVIFDDPLLRPIVSILILVGVDLGLEVFKESIPHRSEYVRRRIEAAMTDYSSDVVKDGMNQIIPFLKELISKFDQEK